MSLAEVQARMADLDSRIRSLQYGGAYGSAPAALGGAATTASDPTSFASALSAATSTAAPAAAGGAAVPVLGAGAGVTGDAVVSTAKRALGTPYVWGGASPTGYDCSGLVQWTYGQLGVPLPRTAAEQARQGRAVTAAEAQPGDLVFFTSPDDHIGIYAGNGQWVEAPHTGDVVKVAPVDLSRAVAIRRILPAPGDAVAAKSTGSLRGLPAAGQPYAAMIAAAAAKAGVDPALLASVAWQESGFNPSAVSGAGAQGLMQLMPRTAAGMGVDPLNPAQALAGGATYLRQQLDAFGGNPSLALAAYNAGPSAVRKYGGVPPYAETENYVNTVLAHVRTLTGST